MTVLHVTHNRAEAECLADCFFRTPRRANFAKIALLRRTEFIPLPCLFLGKRNEFRFTWTGKFARAWDDNTFALRDKAS